MSTSPCPREKARRSADGDTAGLEGPGTRHLDALRRTAPRGVHAPEVAEVLRLGKLVDDGCAVTGPGEATGRPDRLRERPRQSPGGEIGFQLEHADLAHRQAGNSEAGREGQPAAVRERRRRAVEGGRPRLGEPAGLASLQGYQMDGPVVRMGTPRHGGALGGQPVTVGGPGERAEGGEIAQLAGAPAEGRDEMDGRRPGPRGRPTNERNLTAVGRPARGDVPPRVRGQPMDDGGADHRDVDVEVVLLLPVPLEGELLTVRRERRPTRRTTAGRHGNHARRWEGGFPCPEQLPRAYQAQHERERRSREPPASAAPSLGRRSERGLGDGALIDRPRPPRVRVPLQPLEIGAQVRGVLVAEVAVLLEQPVDDVFQLGRDLRVEPHGRRRGLVQDRVEDHRRGRPRERRPPRRHLVEHDPEREEVRPRVQRLPTRLLRRHVGHRAHGRPRARQVLFGRTGRRLRAFRLPRRCRARRSRPSPGRSPGSWPARARSRRCSRA